MLPVWAVLQGIMGALYWAHRVNIWVALWPAFLWLALVAFAASARLISYWTMDPAARADYRMAQYFENRK